MWVVHCRSAACHGSAAGGLRYWQSTFAYVYGQSLKPGCQKKNGRCLEIKAPNWDCYRSNRRVTPETALLLMLDMSMPHVWNGHEALDSGSLLPLLDRDSHTGLVASKYRLPAVFIFLIKIKKRQKMEEEKGKEKREI